MERDEQQFYEIERFLLGEMPEAEAVEFRRRIADNPELAMAVEMQQMELDAGEVLIEEQLRGDMARWKEEGQPDHKPRGKNRNWIWGIGLLVAGLGVWALVAVLQPGGPAPGQEPAPPEKPVSNELAPKLPVAENQPDDPGNAPTQQQETGNEKAQDQSPVREKNNTTTGNARYLAVVGDFYEDLDAANLRGAGNNGQNDPLAPALTAYENRQYEEALKAADQFGKGNSYYIRAQEIKAHALFQLKAYDKSAAVFQSIGRSGLPPYNERAQWNELLCYAARYPADKAQFEAVLAALTADAGHPFHEKAIELGKKIKAAQ
ncbi:MAG TPA: hypothetical protein PKE06_06130 [Flavilitoribacter sp.]|nr:hypothetical protein [Flavilitoribacter sp.]